jgi:hypothetical protein
MVTKKRTAKKKAVKKTKKAARPKKLARRKKLATKPSRTKKPARKAKRVAARASGRREANRKGTRLKATNPPVLGDWTDDAADERAPQPTLFEDDTTPDYGGSK